MKLKIKWWMIVLAVILLFPATIGISIWRGANEIKAMTVGEVDVSLLPDGEYRGRMDTTGIKAEVLVTVQGGRMTGIDIVEHDNGMGETAERIVDDVVAAQSLQVDAVSGATLSSKVILKAVEEALTKN